MSSSSSSSPSGPATFDDKSQTQLERTIIAGTNFDVSSGVLIAALLQAIPSTSSPACPKVTTVGSEVTVAGTCSNGNMTVTGSVVLDNVPALGASATISNASVDFDSFTMSGGGIDLSWDGTVAIDSTGEHADLEASLLGISAHSQLDTTCASSTSCAFAAGSTIDVDGVGTATVSGTWITDYSTVSVTIDGAQSMTVTRTAAQGSGCLDYAIDGGAATQLCGDDLPGS